MTLEELIARLQELVADGVDPTLTVRVGEDGDQLVSDVDFVSRDRAMNTYVGVSTTVYDVHFFL